MENSKPQSSPEERYRLRHAGREYRIQIVDDGSAEKTITVATTGDPGFGWLDTWQTYMDWPLMTAEED